MAHDENHMTPHGRINKSMKIYAAVVRHQRRFTKHALQDFRNHKALCQAMARQIAYSLELTTGESGSSKPVANILAAELVPVKPKPPLTWQSVS